ncbi:MAG: amidase [Williamsia sp.]|nr:amidase [Williamsia sp.]
MPKSVFHIFEIDQFINFIRQTTFQRKITFVQNHHTFKPDYATFNAVPNRHMILLENMRTDHIQNRGWSDIGQNLTIFPDGKVGVCRSIDIKPAGIFGANTGGICIENLGDFDEGSDVMTVEQKESIIKSNAILCIKFGLKPVPHQVVYHHWYDTKGNRFSDTDINSGKVLRNKLQKTCPGTNFFTTQAAVQKGNTIQSATANFYPLIAAEMDVINNVPALVLQPESKKVTASKLNVRAGRGTGFPVIRQLFQGTQVLVFSTEGDWSRVSVNAEEWVSKQFLT